MKFISLTMLLGYSFLIFGWFFALILRDSETFIMLNSISLGIFLTGLIYIFGYAKCTTNETGAKK